MIDEQDPFDGIDPASLAELEASMERAEVEESTALCTYIELTYESAAFLIEQAAKVRHDKDLVAAFELVRFAMSFCDSAEQAMFEAGLHEENPDDEEPF